jgi:hypothetical protein
LGAPRSRVLVYAATAVLQLLYTETRQFSGFFLERKLPRQSWSGDIYWRTALGWDTTNLMARKRQLAVPQLLRIAGAFIAPTFFCAAALPSQKQANWPAHRLRATEANSLSLSKLTRRFTPVFHPFAFVPPQRSKFLRRGPRFARGWDSANRHGAQAPVGRTAGAYCARPLRVEEWTRRTISRI